MDKLLKMWGGIKDFCFKYIGGVVMEEKGGKWAMSIGRVSFVAILGYMMWTWTSLQPGTEMPPELLEALKASLSGENMDKMPELLAALKPAFQAATPTLPDGLMEVFYTVAAYIFGGKAVGAWKAKKLEG